MKMHKLEVYVIDFDDIGIDDIVAELEDISMGMVQVKSGATTDIGKWHDDHELNQYTTPVEVFRKYFREV